MPTYLSIALCGCSSQVPPPPAPSHLCVCGGRRGAGPGGRVLVPHGGHPGGMAALDEGAHVPDTEHAGRTRLARPPARSCTLDTLPGRRPDTLRWGGGGGGEGERRQEEEEVC